MKLLQILLAGVIMMITSNGCRKKDIQVLPEKSAITVTTSPVDTITMNTVTGGGTITSDVTVVTSRGVCWSINPNPTAALITKTKNGSGSGNFKSTIYGLSANTTYYLRAYVISISDTIYGQQVTFKTTTRDTDLVLGQSYAGGIIFYLDATKEHGIVCAPHDQGAAKWGCDGWIIHGTNTAISTGAANTAVIISTCPEEKYSSKICNDLELNSYNDWYQPSKDELMLMYTNLHLKGKGSFGTVYHSSSQYDNNSAWAMSFKEGR